MKNFFKAVLCLFITCFPILSIFSQTASCASWGPYLEGHSMGPEGKGELFYSEVMAEKACMEINTYWSSLNFSVGPRGGYAGIQFKADSTKHNIFSIWDLKDSKTPQCYAEYNINDMHVRGFGGEGTGLHSSYVMNWKPGVWYATVIRRWSIGDGKTRAAFFMYDYSTSKWVHYITMVTPEDNAFLEGVKGGAFLENWNTVGSKAPRCGYYRNFWRMNSDNAWFKPQYYEANAGAGSWKAEVVASNSTIKMTTCGTVLGPTNSPRFTIDQIGIKPATVTIPEIASVTAVCRNNSVIIDWVNHDTKSPQLSYTLKLYSNSGLQGTPIVTKTIMRPDRRSDTTALAASLPLGTYYVTLQMMDIFNQLSTVKTISFNKKNHQILTAEKIYKIKNVHSGKYLAIENKSLSDGAYLVQYDNSNSAGSGNNVRWQIVPEGSAYVLKNINSNKAIDLSGAIQTAHSNPIQYAQHNRINQQWNLISTNENTFLIQSNMSDHFVLDNPGGSTRNGEKMIIYTINTNGEGSHNQHWFFEEDGPVAVKQVVAHRPLDQFAKPITDAKPFARSGVSPNPTKGILNINYNENANGELQLLNANGQILLKKNITPGRSQIDITGYSAGVYLLKITNDNNRPTIIKIIKE